MADDTTADHTGGRSVFWDDLDRDLQDPEFRAAYADAFEKMTFAERYARHPDAYPATVDMAEVIEVFDEYYRLRAELAQLQEATRHYVDARYDASRSEQARDWESLAILEDDEQAALFTLMDLVGWEDPDRG